MAVAAQPLNGGLKRLASWGTGVGIAVEGADLRVVVARLRPSGVVVAGQARIANVEERPSAEWGTELSAFLRKHDATHSGAVVVLPRRAVTVRSVPMSGVADADLAQAVSFQVDALHPYDETDAVYSWAKLAQSNQVLVGVAQASVVSAWASRFAEAGVKLASVSFSAAAFYTATRLYRTPPGEFLAAGPNGEDNWELYGESEARPVFSSSFDTSERMLAMARADLRLPGDAEVLGIERVLPPPVSAPEGFDVREAAVAYAGAMASATPRLALPANLLPEAQRAGGSAWVYAPTVVLGGLLVIATGMLMAQESYQDRQYLKRLNAEIERHEKLAQRAQTLDRETAAAQARVKLIDDFRHRSSADAEALKELTTLVAPPGWVSNLQLSRTDVNLSGESEQSATFVESFDRSPLFANSALGQAGVTSFSLRTNREGPGTGNAGGAK